MFKKIINKYLYGKRHMPFPYLFAENQMYIVYYIYIYIKKQKPFLLTLKGVILIYLPIILSIHILYSFILEKDLVLYWTRVLIYSSIVGGSMIVNYKYKKMEKNLDDFTE